MELHLKRTPSRRTCTISPLFVDDSAERECFILEDMVREITGEPVSSWKIDGETAIPTGRYQIFWTKSHRLNRWTPELSGVEGYTGVRIHSVHDAGDTEGCLGTGTTIAQDAESVLGGFAARDHLYEIIHEALSRGEEV